MTTVRLRSRVSIAAFSAGVCVSFRNTFTVRLLATAGSLEALGGGFPGVSVGASQTPRVAVGAPLAVGRVLAVAAAPGGSDRPAAEAERSNGSATAPVTAAPTATAAIAPTTRRRRRDSPRARMACGGLSWSSATSCPSSANASRICDDDIGSVPFVVVQQRGQRRSCPGEIDLDRADRHVRASRDLGYRQPVQVVQDDDAALRLG